MTETWARKRESINTNTFLNRSTQMSVCVRIGCETRSFSTHSAHRIAWRTACEEGMDGKNFLKWMVGLHRRNWAIEIQFGVKHILGFAFAYATTRVNKQKSLLVRSLASLLKHRRQTPYMHAFMPKVRLHFVRSYVSKLCAVAYVWLIADFVIFIEPLQNNFLARSQLCTHNKNRQLASNARALVLTLTHTLTVDVISIWQIHISFALQTNKQRKYGREDEKKMQKLNQ